MRPLRQRPLDIGIMIFFAVNLFFVTYIVDIEQLTVADPFRFEYPLWPPRWGVDMVHWWGRTFDPLLMARPPWWRATIWIDAVYFGPFYAFALYAFYKGRDWIRTPAMLWAGLMVANVTIIMFEETIGAHKSPRWNIVALANLPWFTMPFLVMARLRKEQPFTS
jgi:hypothetical protein